jgi:exopolyphosphatase/guanosine-5'-triphosphate,3'-diphosphate pyrophosphatase
LQGLQVAVRVAVIDIGTNSTRLFIAESDHGAPQELNRTTTITGLGKNCDETGCLNKAAIAGTAAVLKTYAGIIADHHVDMVRAAATAAMRNGTNANEALDAFEESLGVRPKIISGEMEAHLTYCGVLSDPFIAHMGLQFQVIDIGGGSTEIIRGLSRPQIAKSIPLGCVGLQETFFKSDPPTAAEIEAARQYATHILASEFDCDINPRTVGLAVAGTATSLAAIELELEPYDPVQIHRFRLTAECVRRLLTKMAALPIADLQKIVGLEPKRADTIVSGTIMLAAIMDYFQFEFVLVSERDILDGLAITAIADYNKIKNNDLLEPKG